MFTCANFHLYELFQVPANAGMEGITSKNWLQLVPIVLIGESHLPNAATPAK